MKKITFITGGIKSGKSNLAVHKAEQNKQTVAFVATATAFDDEMQDRIQKHKDSRPSEWALFEEPHNIDTALKQAINKYNIVIVDCLGVWVTNLMMAELSDEEIMNKADVLIKTFAKIDYNLIIVSNETGLGLIPTNKMGRKFCDLLGMINQKIAKAADDVYLMASGIPLKLK